MDAIGHQRGKFSVPIEPKRMQTKIARGKNPRLDSMSRKRRNDMLSFARGSGQQSTMDATRHRIRRRLLEIKTIPQQLPVLGMILPASFDQPVHFIDLANPNKCIEIRRTQIETRL